MRYKFFKKTNEARGRAKTRRRADLKIPALFWEVWDPAGKDSRIKDSNRLGIAFFHRPKVASFLRPRTSLDAPAYCLIGVRSIGRRQCRRQREEAGCATRRRRVRLQNRCRMFAI